MKYDIHICISLIGEGVPGGTMRGGGSAVRFHDCTNNSAMTNMRDIKDMVSLLGLLGIFFEKFPKHFVALRVFIYKCINYKVYG